MYDPYRKKKLIHISYMLSYCITNVCLFREAVIIPLRLRRIYFRGCGFTATDIGKA